MNFTILKFDTIESTNTEAINEAKRGADEGLCIVAQEQTAGRGRHGRVWVSPKDAGIYFSLVLRPRIDIRFLPLITLMAAAAVHDTLEKIYDFDCDIKWVNDIHVREKKICGVLAETVETEKGLAVIVGIGVNLTSKNFPPEISETATSVEDETEERPDSENLLFQLTHHLSKFCEILYGENGAEKIRQAWIERSSYAFDKEILAKISNEIVVGKTCGIEENGALRVKTSDGKIRIISAGEIKQLRAAKYFIK